MIDIQKRLANGTRLVVQGNQSMSWRANLWLAASLGFIVLGIGIVLASYGLWMVIPFAGAEVVLIVCCLYLTLRRLSHKEIITVDEDAIRVEWGYTHADTTVELPRRWSRLRYHCPESLFEVGDLRLAAHGRSYALGKCLNRDEKKQLYTELHAAMSR